MFAVSPADLLSPFHGAALAVLVLAAVAFVTWLIIFVIRWAASFPDLPDAAPATMDLGPEPPAIAALLVNRWSLPRTAIAATLVDLAARHQLGIDDVGGDAVIRIRQGREEALSDYEEQLMRLVRSRATGGSAPVEALDLGEESAATAWWQHFEKAVVAQAKALGLARSRWSHNDWAVLGGGLLVAAELLALALALGHVAGDKNPDGSRDLQWGWPIWVLFGWFAVMGVAFKVDQLRDTPAGRVACSRWLGVRQYLRNSHAFADAPPAAVALWDRYLAYAVGLGVARHTAHELPIAAEEPGVAWSRETGSWRQLRVHYPTSFSYGEQPAKVLFRGLVTTIFFGVIAFYVLPFMFGFVIDVAGELLSAQHGWGERALIGGFGLGFGLIGVFFLAKLVVALMRLFRGIFDLGTPPVVEGLVVKSHLGRVAVDTGKADEVDAWMPLIKAPTLARGMRVRASVTRHLHYVSEVSIVSGAELAPSPEAAVGLPAMFGGAGMATFAPIDLEAVRAATGIALHPAQAGEVGARSTVTTGGEAGPRMYADGSGGWVSVTGLTFGAALTPMFAMFARIPAFTGQKLSGPAGDAWWLHDRELITHNSEEAVVVVADLPHQPAHVRQAVAMEVARQALASGGAVGSSVPMNRPAAPANQ